MTDNNYDSFIAIGIHSNIPGLKKCICSTREYVNKKR